MGLGSIIVVIYDVVIVMGFFLLLGLEFIVVLVVVLLILIGYLFNDLIIVLDCICENMKIMCGYSYCEIVNVVIN